MKLNKCVSALLAISLLLSLAAIGEASSDDITGLWVNVDGESQTHFRFSANGEMESNADGSIVTGTYSTDNNVIFAEINFVGITGSIKWDYSLNGDTLTINGIAYIRHFEKPSDAELITGKWLGITVEGRELTLQFDADGSVTVSASDTDVEGEYALDDNILSLKLNMLGSVMEKSTVYLLESDTLTLGNTVYSRVTNAELSEQLTERLLGEWCMLLNGIEVSINFMPHGKLLMSMTDALKVEGTYGVNGNRLSLTFPNSSSYKTEIVEFGFEGDRLRIYNDLYTRVEAE